MSGLPQLPFTHEEVQECFPELIVSVPPLGQGSFKVAYRAESDGLEHVLKIIYDFAVDEDPDEFDLEQVPDRIVRELSGMSSVDSPHVVTLLAQPRMKRIGNKSYLCYEEPFYAGGTLQDRLRAGPLSRVEVRTLLVSLLGASAALWNADKIVHRDIKPGNIAFDSDGTPVLLDLGLVLFTELSALTDSRALSPMTTLYAAPEQFEQRRGAQIDFRTDQYLIGLTVLEAIRGSHPFFQQGMDFYDLLEAMEKFAPSSLLGDGIDDDVREVVGRLLSFPQYGRYRAPHMPLEKLGVQL